MPQPKKYATKEEAREAKLRTSREYYQNHKEQMKAAYKKWHQEHKESHNKYMMEIYTKKRCPVLEIATTTQQTPPTMTEKDIEKDLEELQRQHELFMDRKYGSTWRQLVDRKLENSSSEIEPNFDMIVDSATQDIPNSEKSAKPKKKGWIWN